MKLSLILFTLLFLNSAFSKTYSLNDLLTKIKNHPDVLESDFEISKAENQFLKIKGETGPKLSTILGVGPNYTTTGNALNSTQSNDLNTKTYLAQIEIKIPVFTFFREQDYKDAALKNKEVKEIEKIQKLNELERKAKEIYYGFQYASSLFEYASETQKDLENALEDFAKSKRNGSEEHSKLKIFYNVVLSKKLEIEKSLKLAKLGIQYLTQDFDGDISLDQNWIQFNEYTVRPLNELLSNFEETHLDFKKVKLGINAYEAFTKGESKSKLPTFGIFGKYDWINTDKSQVQQSKFSYDPYNQKNLSIGLGLIWDFDFGSKDYKIEESRVELQKLIVKKSLAEKSIPLKISKIYFELEELTGKVKNYESAYKQSKKLMNRLGSEVALGLTPAKDIIEVYTTKAEMYKNYLEAIYQYELKYSELISEI